MRGGDRGAGVSGLTAAAIQTACYVPPDRSSTSSMEASGPVVFGEAADGVRLPRAGRRCNLCQGRGGRKKRAKCTPGACRCHVHTGDPNGCAQGDG